MKPTSPRAKALLAQYRRDQALPPALRARALHAIEQRLRAEPAPQGVEQASPTPRPSWLSAPRGLLLGGALSVAVLWAALSWPSALDAPPAQPAPPARSVAASPAQPAPPARRVAASPAQPAPLGVRSVASESPARPAPLAARSVAGEPPVSIASEQRAAPVEPPVPSSLASPKAQRSSAQPRRSEPVRAPSSVAAPRASEAAAQPAARVEPELSAPQPVAPSGAGPAPRTPAVAAEARTSSALLPAPISGSREPAAPASTLDAEVMQLREAHDRLRAGEPLRALSALAEHARRFPDGKLVALREVAQMQALCDLGQVERAREAAGRFLRAHARSPYAQRVRHMCDRAPSAPSKIE